MAGPITHMLVSQAASDPTVVTTMDPVLQGILIDWQPFLLLGSVGPDLPAIIDVARGQHMSDRLHDGGSSPRQPTNTIVCALYKALKGESPDCAPFAFLIGYVSHMAADCRVHPIVKAVIGTGSLDHRNCETVQDTLLFRDYMGQNIKKSDYLSWLELCNKQPDALDGILDLWQPIVDTYYGHYSCRDWVKSYETGFSIARQAYHIDGWSYPSPEEVTDEEVKRYYSQVKLPLTDHRGHFKTEVFDGTVRITAQLWELIYRRFIDPGDRRGIEDLVPDWDLNDGKNFTTGRAFDLWREP